jgi:hypothetical protein
MRMKNTVRAALAVTAAASALFLPLGATAYADDVGGGAAVFETCGGTHCVAGTLETTIYPSGLGFDVVEFKCTVTASGAAASTTVSECNVGGVDALVVPLSAPGPAVATAGVGTFPSGSVVTACVAGNAVWVESLAGPGSLPGRACAKTIVISV